MTEHLPRDPGHDSEHPGGREEPGRRLVGSPVAGFGDEADFIGEKVARHVIPLLSSPQQRNSVPGSVPGSLSSTESPYAATTSSVGSGTLSPKLSDSYRRSAPTPCALVFAKSLDIPPVFLRFLQTPEHQGLGTSHPAEPLNLGYIRSGYRPSVNGICK